MSLCSLEVCRAADDWRSCSEGRRVIQRQQMRAVQLILLKPLKFMLAMSVPTLKWALCCGDAFCCSDILRQFLLEIDRMQERKCWQGIHCSAVQFHLLNCGENSCSAMQQEEPANIHWDTLEVQQTRLYAEKSSCRCTLPPDNFFDTASTFG